MNRRSMLKSAALIAAAAPVIASAEDSLCGGHSPAFPVRKRLDQGPFDIEQDEGWRTALFTTPSEKPLRNPGLGLVGYTWEENGPALAVRSGKRKLADEIEQDRKSTRLNSSHVAISYAVFCLKKKKKPIE